MAKLDNIERRFDEGNKVVLHSLKTLNELANQMKLGLQTIGGMAFVHHQKSLEVFPLKTIAEFDEYLASDPDLNLMSVRLSEVDYNGDGYALALLDSIFSRNLIVNSLTWNSIK